MKDVIRFIGFLAGAAIFATTVYAILAGSEILFGDDAVRVRTVQEAGR